MMMTVVILLHCMLFFDYDHHNSCWFCYCNYVNVQSQVLVQSGWFLTDISVNLHPHISPRYVAFLTLEVCCVELEKTGTARVRLSCGTRPESLILVRWASCLRHTLTPVLSEWESQHLMTAGWSTSVVRWLMRYIFVHGIIRTFYEHDNNYTCTQAGHPVEIN